MPSSNRTNREAKAERKPFSRKGLHRLECGSCDGFLYATIATLEARGLPRCGWCQDTMHPTMLEVALMIGDDNAPAMSAYREKVSSVAHGQAHTGRDPKSMESPEFRALFGDVKRPDRDPGLIAQQRADMRRRKIAALLPTPAPMPF